MTYRGCWITPVEPRTLAERYVAERVCRRGGPDEPVLFKVTGRFNKRAELRPFLTSWREARAWVDDQHEGRRRRIDDDSEGDDGERDVSGVGQ